MTTQLPPCHDLATSIWQQLVEGLPEALLAVDSEHRIRVANRRTQDLFGYMLNELIGQPLDILLPTSLAATHRVKFDKFKQRSGQSKRMADERIVLARHKDGSEFPIEVRISAGQPGDSQLSTAVIRDLRVVRSMGAVLVSSTEEQALRQFEQAIDQQRDRARAERRFNEMLIANLPVGIFRTDRDGNCVFTNQRWRDIAGLSDAEALGHGWARATHHVDAEATLAAWQSATKLGGVFRHEFRFQHVETKVVSWVQSEAFPELDYNGEVVGYVGSITDITHLRAAKDEVERSRWGLAEAQRIAHIGSWDWNIEEDGLWWSAEVYRIFGLSPQEFRPTFEAFMVHVHPDDCEIVRTAVRLAVEGIRPYGIEHRIVLEDGRIAIVRESGEVVRNANGLVVRMIGTVQDITSLRKTEDQIRSKQRLEALGRLAGGVAHDFNNLLKVMQSSTFLLRQDPTRQGEQLDEVNQLDDAITRATNLTRQLLVFGSQLTLKQVAVDIDLALRAIEPMLNKLLPQNIELQLHLSSHSKVSIDIGQFDQVLLKLSLNARDAMHKGGRIEWHSSTIEIDGSEPMLEGLAPGTYVLLTIEDTGEGIAAAIVDRIFDPFFSTKKEGKGTGLGLATVYGAIRQSGGTIRVQSTVGVGTTFTIYLPSADATTDIATRPSGERGEQKANGTLLLVEDEPLIRSATVGILRSAGFDVLEAEDGQEGLALYLKRAADIDLVITDVVMPVMRGGELATQVRRRYPKAKFIFVTGHPSDSSLAPLLNGDNALLLRKPTHPLRLIEAVSLMLGQSDSPHA